MATQQREKEPVLSITEKANAILERKRQNGMTGIRFFVPDNRDLSDEDIMRGFCEMAASDEGTEDITDENL